LPIVGVFPQFRGNPPEYLLKAARQYGDLVYLPLGRQKVYFLNHPDMVREVLVTQQHKFKKSRMLERAKVLLGEGLLTSEGGHHLRQRRLVQPAFHRERLMGYASTMVDRASVAANRLQGQSNVEMDKEMARLTMDIVCRTLFSTQVDAEVDEIGTALNDVFGLFDLVLMPFSEFIEKLPLPSVRRFHRAKHRLDETIYRLIAEHRASGKDSGDLLSMMLMAQDEAEDGGPSQGMSDQQVRDEALTLFLAGHETTANALTWAWYLLSQNPETEAKFHAEIEQVLGGRTPTFDDLPNLPYTTGVLSDALRLYPPAWAIGRRALEDVEIGGYAIPQGVIILVCPYVMHRDPRWFPEPEKFQPERWLPENVAAQPERPKFAFFPFGGGARVCIGERFAWMEGVLLLATLGQRWSFRLQPGHVVDIKGILTLRPKYGMRMIAESRT
jgi:cytochrome P450